MDMKLKDLKNKTADEIFFACIEESTIKSCIKKVIVVKQGEDLYVDLRNGNELKRKQISRLEPFSRYYTKKDFRFLKKGNSIQLDIRNLEPYEEYLTRNS